MDTKIIWHLPQVKYQSLSEITENRPAAVITEPIRWARVKDAVKLPIVVQAEPERMDHPFLSYLGQNLPSTVEVVYAVGNSKHVMAGKIIANENKIPLVIVPTELDSDQIFEPHVETLTTGILQNVFTGPAESIIIDWDVINAAPTHQRAGIVADMLAIVTGLLDWNYAISVNKNDPAHPFTPWATSIAARIAQETLVLAPKIGEGNIEAMHTLMDLTAVSVQLANQLGHARYQEGSEHYFAYAAEKHGAKDASHAECLAPGILLTSALHGQDSRRLRDALEQAGIKIDAVPNDIVQRAAKDMPNFAEANKLPHGIAHDIKLETDMLQKAMEAAKLTGVIGDTEAMIPADATTPQEPVDVDA